MDEPADVTLEGLVECARHDGLSPQEVAQLATRVGGALGAGVALTSSASASASHLTWLKLVGLVGVVTAAASVAVYSQTSTSPARTQSSKAGRTTAPLVEPSPPPPEPAPVAPVVSTTPPQPSPQPPASRSGRAATETQLLERARRLLPRAPGRSLALTRRHARQYPNGALAQESAVIAIDALLRMERPGAARRRAEAFFAAHPDSAYQPRIRQLLRRGGIESP